MSRPLIISCFLALVSVQLAVPSCMIDKRQTTLDEGTAYQFRVGPVDPYDPFLGRYLVLDLEVSAFAGWKGEPLQQGQTLFAALENDSKGFAKVVDLSMDPPGTRDYLRARVAWQSGQDVRLELPFTRYYVEENAAQVADHLRQNNRRQPVRTHIQVRVLNGFGVLEELYFEGKPLLEYLRHRGIWPPSEAGQPEATGSDLSNNAANSD